jgi:hypothetical protein
MDNEVHKQLRAGYAATLTLTAEELVEITGYLRPSAQARALRKMGVEHRIRNDGRVIVLRSYVEALLGGGSPAKVQQRTTEPNWSALASHAKA